MATGYVGNIPAASLLFHGFGSAQPVVTTLKSEVQNRRVEIRRITSVLALGGFVRGGGSLDCDEPGPTSFTVVLVNFSRREDEKRIREIVRDLPNVSNLELIEANGGYSKYAAKVSQLGCRIVEQIEDRLKHEKIKVTLRGSIIRIERL